MRYKAKVDGHVQEFETKRGEGNSHRVTAAATEHALTLGTGFVEWDGITFPCEIEHLKHWTTRVKLGEQFFDVELIKDRKGADSPGRAPAPTRPRIKLEGGQPVTAPMPGTLVAINVQEGQAVEAGQVLVVLEAMKMENEIKAGHSGTIRQIAVKAGDSVNGGDVLVVLE